MLSVSQCKRILEEIEDDEQVEEIRDALYKAARILVEEFIKDGTCEDKGSKG